METPLGALTTRRIEEYRTARLSTTSRRGSTLSPATVNRECALLRSILRMAYRWDEIAKVPAFTMAKETARERFLSHDEIARLPEACAKSTNAQLRAIVTVGIHTGLRKGELLALEWEQVDLSRGVIALGRRTKSGKGRDVPINPAVYATLAPLRQAAGGLDAAGLVWGTPKKIDTTSATALRRAKILDPDVTFHTLRHTFASHYVMRGGSIVKLQAILATPACVRRRSTRAWRLITWSARRASSTASARPSAQRQHKASRAPTRLWKPSCKCAILRRPDRSTAP